MPRVSVVLPTYNGGSTLSRSVESVIAQGYCDFELIVVDDGSTDNTECLILHMANRDQRIKYLKHATNLGANAARNTGISASSGGYIAFQDSDDEWLPGKLAKQVAILESSPGNVGVTYCLMMRVDAEGRSPFNSKQFFPNDDNLFKKGLMYEFRGIGGVACLFRREVFEKCGGFDEELRSMQDMEMLIRAAREFRFHCLPEILVNYYDSPGSTSKNHSKALASALHIYEKYRSDIKKDYEVCAAQYRRIGIQFGKTRKRRQEKIYKMKSLFFEWRHRFSNHS